MSIAGFVASFARSFWSCGRVAIFAGAVIRAGYERTGAGVHMAWSNGQLKQPDVVKTPHDTLKGALASLSSPGIAALRALESRAVAATGFSQPGGPGNRPARGTG